MSLCGIEKICANYQVNCTGCVRCSNYASKNQSVYKNTHQLKFGRYRVKDSTLKRGDM